MTSQVSILQNRVNEQEERIEKLWDTIIEHAEHIEKLEAMLRDVVRCLIDGKVDMAALMPGELHRHRILGIESVQAMVEVYHRLQQPCDDDPRI